MRRAPRVLVAAGAVILAAGLSAGCAMHSASHAAPAPAPGGQPAHAAPVVVSATGQGGTGPTAGVPAAPSGALTEISQHLQQLNGNQTQLNGDLASADQEIANGG